MNILIAGATGFVGRHLIAALKADHRITALSRQRSQLQRYFDASVQMITWNELDAQDASQYHVIINLCGHNIADSRWSQQVKRLLIESRVQTNTQLIQWVIKHQAKPRYICANAIGIYGMHDGVSTEIFDEDSPVNFEQPCDYLSEIGVRWQQSLQPAMDYGLEVTTTRFGVILGHGEGLLKKLIPSFYMGMGAVIGDGQQVISWVDIDDVVGAIQFLLAHPAITGAVNVTSPYPVSQAEFARTLASAMHRPLWLHIPAFLIRWLFGEMGESLLLKGQRVMPKRLASAGYVFHYPQLVDALRHQLGHKPEQKG